MYYVWIYYFICEYHLSVCRVSVLIIYIFFFFFEMLHSDKIDQTLCASSHIIVSKYRLNSMKFKKISKIYVFYNVYLELDQAPTLSALFVASVFFFHFVLCYSLSVVFFYVFARVKNNLFFAAFAYVFCFYFIFLNSMS